MKNFSLITSSCLLLSIMPLTTKASQKELKKKSSNPKNVLFIAVDDLKPLLGCYGDKIAKTPTIDALAQRGCLFTNAYCQQAISGPTRASLLTGVSPDQTKVWDLKTQLRDQCPNIVTLPQYFKKYNYDVVGYGKIYDPRTVDKGYDSVSWSKPYVIGIPFLNAAYGKPLMSHYQSPILKEKFENIYKEAKTKGLKGYKAKRYAYKQIKMSTECIAIPDDAYLDGAIAKGAVDYLENYKGNKPFFLAVGFKKPHLPFCAPKKYWDLYKREEMPLAVYRKRSKNGPSIAYHKSGELRNYSDIPSLISFNDVNNLVLPDEKARELIHGYYACVSYMDAQLAKVIKVLKEKGLDKNTIIVFWGDHGWHLGDHGLWNKHSNFEQATHVPMLIVDPSSKKRRVSHPVAFLDIYPTLCRMTGLPVASYLEGQDLSSIVFGDTKATNLSPYVVSQYPRGKRMGYSIRTQQYRYTVWVNWKNKKTIPNDVFAEELYDYKNDPNETINIVKDRKYQKILDKMKEYWQQECKKRFK